MNLVLQKDKVASLHWHCKFVFYVTVYTYTFLINIPVHFHYSMYTNF